MEPLNDDGVRERQQAAMDRVIAGLRQNARNIPPEQQPLADNEANVWKEAFITLFLWIKQICKSLV